MGHLEVLVSSSYVPGCFTAEIQYSGHTMCTGGGGEVGVQSGRASPVRLLL